MNTAKDFKGNSRVPKGFKFSYQENLYNNNDMEIHICDVNEVEINATIAYDGEDFILSYDNGMYQDALRVISFKEAMTVIKELTK